MGETFSLDDFFRELQVILVECESFDSTSLRFMSTDVIFVLNRIRNSVRALNYLTEECLNLQMHINLPAQFQSLREVGSKFLELQNYFTEKLRSPRLECCELGQSDILLETTDEHIRPGRPRVFVNIQQVEFLFQAGFSLSSIAKIAQVHKVTIMRRLNDHGIILERYSDISDEDLVDLVGEIHSQHPHSGLRMITGHLRSRNIFVQRYRVEMALRYIDPASSVIRWGLMARRRKYCVEGPNALWHIDGHHALIRWRLVSHGGIDGHSRLIVFLKCSDNNRSETVRKLFLEAVNKYGTPSRVRGDRGVENIGVLNLMEDLRGCGRGSFIQGRSVHNSRIERLWRDVYYAVVQTYYSLFYYLESCEILDVDNEIDIFCLHYTYVFRINKSLDEFAYAYNMHPLRTERNWTPMQIWVNGHMHLGNQYQTGALMNDPITDYALYGIDAGAAGLDPCEGNDDAGIEVPETSLPLTSGQYNELLEILPQVCSSNDYGITMYSAVRQYVNSCLQ